MEEFTTSLIGMGVLLSALNILLGIIELATLRTIRAPAQKTFTYIRRAANQYQTIVIPAMGALISGLFVSISASFFYEGLTNPDDSWRQTAGSATFIVGAVALTFTLRAVIKGVGEPAELASDPFTIHAAADEYSAAPRRGSLEPSFLEERLEEWIKFISARAMNITSKKTAPGLDEILNHAVEQHGFWRCAAASLHLYFAALVRFPFRFFWPFLGIFILFVGITWYAVGVEVPDDTTWQKRILNIATILIVSALVTLFYCATRGNRARLWHRINLVAVEDARKAISSARSAQNTVEKEDAILQRVIQRADIFLQEEHTSRANSGISFTLGTFHIAITSRKTQNQRGKTSQPSHTPIERSEHHLRKVPPPTLDTLFPSG